MSYKLWIKFLQKSLKNHKGFTLLELLLCVSIIALLAGFSLPIYRTLQIRNDIDIATVTITESLHRAQILSQAVDGDSQWGVRIQSGSITVFKGASFATRTATYDESFSLPITITPSGLAEVVYSKMNGLPQSTGTITLSSESDTRIITLNTKGMVTY